MKPAEAKDRADAFITLSAQLHEQYHQRRSLEWQVHIALWTLLAAAAYVLATQAPTVNPLALVASLAAVLLVHLVFSVKIHQGQILEQDLSIVYRHQAESLLREGTAIPNTDVTLAALATAREERTPMSVRLQARFENYYWWLGAELGTTALIALVVYFLAINAVPPASKDSISALQAELTLVRSRLDAAEARLERAEQTPFLNSTPPLASAPPK